MGTTGAVVISPERTRNRDQEDVIEMSGGLGRADRVPICGAIDDRKEVDRQFVRRRTSISLEDSRTIYGAYWTGVLNFQSIVLKTVRAKSALEGGDFLPNVGDRFCVVRT